MNSGAITTTKAKGVVSFDDQHKFQVDVGYVAARQKAIDLAMVVDEDCFEWGIERLPTGVASWIDDRVLRCIGLVPTILPTVELF